MRLTLTTQEMHERLQKEIFDTNTREYWMEKLIANGGIPTGPVYSYVDLIQEQQFWYSQPDTPPLA